MLTADCTKQSRAPGQVTAAEAASPGRRAAVPRRPAPPFRCWITEGEQPWAGIVQADTAGGGWLPYVVVQDLDEAAERAVSLGATVIAGAADGPAGTSVTIADPGGARLALFKPHAGRG